MSSNVTIKLNPAWQAQLQKDVAATLEKLGQIVAENAQRLAPVETGALRDSIESHMEGNDTVVVSAGTDHAAFVEMGTSRMAAEPYLRPALSSVGGQL